MQAGRLMLIAGMMIMMVATQGCAMSMKKGHPMPGAYAVNPALQGRMLIKKASLRLRAADVEDVGRKASEAVTKAGGYVADLRASEDDGVQAEFQVPAERLEATLDQLAGLGTVISRSISLEDVTAKVVDVEAVLKNKIALRDRLQKLLERASDVKDVLAIEEQLTRLQTEIDAAEGQLKALKGQVAFSSISLSVERRKILGPLGYAFKGMSWLIGKLFVIE